jgi:hypothetical protein
MWIQEELPNKFYSINQQHTKTLEDLVDIGKTNSEMEQALTAYVEDDHDNDDDNEHIHTVSDTDVKCK